MEFSAETLGWLERCFARAVRYFRQKGRNEQDAEDCAAEVRLHLLKLILRGGTLSNTYFQRVLHGCLSDFIEQTQSLPLSPLEDADLHGGGPTFGADTGSPGGTGTLVSCRSRAALEARWGGLFPWGVGTAVRGS